MKAVVITIGILGAGALILLGSKFFVPDTSSAALGRPSTPIQCSAFESSLVQEQSQAGSNIQSQSTLGPDTRCYVELSLLVSGRHLHALVIDDGGSGVDVARCTIEDDHQATTTNFAWCIDPLDNVATYSAYQAIRDKVFQE